MDDYKLLQDLNLTAWQPCSAPIIQYILIDQCCLAKVGLINLMRSMVYEIGSSELHASVFPTTLQTPPSNKNKTKTQTKPSNPHLQTSRPTIRDNTECVSQGDL